MEITNEKEFARIIERGIKYAEQDKIVTFGINPTFPETGFGYIETENSFNVEMKELGYL